MTARRRRWGAVSRIAFVIRAPMAFAVPKLPDLDSAVGVQRFAQRIASLLEAVICSVN